MADMSKCASGDANNTIAGREGTMSGATPAPPKLDTTFPAAAYFESVSATAESGNNRFERAGNTTSAMSRKSGYSAG